MLFFNAFFKYFLRFFNSLMSSLIETRARFVLATQSLEWAEAAARPAAGAHTDKAAAGVEAEEEPAKFSSLKRYFTASPVRYFVASTVHIVPFTKSWLLTYLL
ncbi:unnamed protein product [Mucor circinelloides]